MTPWRITAFVATVMVLLICGVGALLCFGLYVLPSTSMEDTLMHGDRLFVEKIGAYLGRDPKDGDIVVHLYPPDRAQVYVKRIVGVPGDRLRIVNKQLYRNGSAVAESYVKHITSYVDSYRDNFPSSPTMPLLPMTMAMLQNNVQGGEVVVPKGRYFVMGDNRDDSSDSRYWGFVSKSDIIGRPVLVYLSIEEDSSHSPPVAKVRWKRFFKHL